jgi:hypothetical protein
MHSGCAASRCSSCCSRTGLLHQIEPDSRARGLNDGCMIGGIVHRKAPKTSRRHWDSVLSEALATGQQQNHHFVFQQRAHAQQVAIAIAIAESIPAASRRRGRARGGVAARQIAPKRFGPRQARPRNEYRPPLGTRGFDRRSGPSIARSITSPTARSRGRRRRRRRRKAAPDESLVLEALKGNAGVGDERRLRHSQAHHRTARAACYPWACARRPHHIRRRPRPFARSEQARGGGPVSRGWLPRGAESVFESGAYQQRLSCTGPMVGRPVTSEHPPGSAPVMNEMFG